MNTSDITQIDREIATLERQLSTLHSRKLAVLEQQVRESQERIRSFSGVIRRTVAEAPSARSLAPKDDSPQVKPVPRGRRPKAVAKKKRTRTPSNIVNEKILDTLKAGGAEGLSQKEISVRAEVNYQTTAKKLRELPGIVKKGSGKVARYSLKA